TCGLPIFGGRGRRRQRRGDRIAVVQDRGGGGRRVDHQALVLAAAGRNAGDRVRDRGGLVVDVVKADRDRHRADAGAGRDGDGLAVGEQEAQRSGRGNRAGAARQGHRVGDRAAVLGGRGRRRQRRGDRIAVVQDRGGGGR